MMRLNANTIGNLMNLLIRPNREISQREFDSLFLKIIEKIGKRDEDLAKIIKTEKLQAEKGEIKHCKNNILILAEMFDMLLNQGETEKATVMSKFKKDEDEGLKKETKVVETRIKSFELENQKQEENNKIFAEMFNLPVNAGKVKEVGAISKLKKSKEKVDVINMKHRKIIHKNHSLEEIKGKKEVSSKKEQLAEMNIKKQEKGENNLQIEKKFNPENIELRLKADNLKIKKFGKKRIKLSILKEDEKRNPEIRRQFLIIKENSGGHGEEKSLIQSQSNHQGKADKDIPLSLNNAKSVRDLELIRKQEKKIKFDQKISKLGLHKTSNFQDNPEKIKSSDTQPLMTDEDKYTLINKISQEIHYQIKENGKEEIIVHLKPEFLGKVSIKIISEGDHIKINMLTENHMAKEILNPYIPSLQRFLLEQGIPVQEISLFLAWQGYQENRQAQEGYRFKSSFLKSNHHPEPALKEVSYGYTSDAVYLDYLA